MKKKRWLNLLWAVLLVAVLAAPLVPARPVYAAAAVEILRPNAPGDETSINVQYPSTGAHWDKVDDIAGGDGDSTCVHTISNTFLRDLYSLPAHSEGTGTISFIKIYFRVALITSNYAQAKPSLKIDGVVIDGTAVSGPIWPTYSLCSQQWNTNPVDNQPWEWSDIDNLQIGVSLRGWSYGALCTQIYVEVGYLTSPSVATTAATVEETTATLNGNVTAINDTSITERGFVWDTASHGDPGFAVPASSGYSNNWTESDNWSMGSFSDNITVSPGTIYYIRACAKNNLGNWGYGNEVTFGVPLIIANAASNIAGTSARLNSTVSYDGGVACQVRWGYGETSQPADNFTGYDNVTDWSGSYTTGQHPFYDASGCDNLTTYHYRVQVKNSYSILTSTDEIDFETKSGVSDPSNLRGVPSGTSISLTWTKGEGSTESILRYRMDTYPSSYTDGQLAYQGTSPSYNHSGLSPGTTYYYAVWGKSGTYYSGSSQTMCTTSAGSTEVGGTLETPTEPSRWMEEPNYANLQGLGPIYAAVNMGADAIKMPRETAWMISAIIAAVGFAFLVLLLSRGSVLGSLIALTIGLAFGWAIKIVPLWFPAGALIIDISFFLVRKRET